MDGLGGHTDEETDVALYDGWLSWVSSFDIKMSCKVDTRVREGRSHLSVAAGPSAGVVFGHTPFDKQHRND